MSEALIFKGKDVFIPNNNVASYVMEKMLSRKDLIAFVSEQYKNSKITYGELYDQIEKLATVLNENKIKKGDVVAVYATSSYRFFVSSIAILRLGGIVTTTAVNLTPNDVASQWSNNNVKLVFLDNILVSKAELAISQMSSREINFIILDDNPSQSIPTLIGNYSDLINSVTEVKIPEIKIEPSDTAVILHSSGSTGKPKGVVITHSSAINNSEDLRCLEETEEGFVMLCVFSMVHAAGFFTSLGFIFSGCTIINLPFFDLSNMIRLIEVYKVNGLGIPPSVVVLLMKSEHFHNFSSIKSFYVGGSAMGSSLENAFIEHIKLFKCTGKIVQIYAMTEMVGILISPKDKKHKSGSVGCPTINVEVKLIGENGLPVPANTFGEIICRGPNLMKEYLNNEEATKATIDEEGFLHTGDVAYYDEEGYFFLVDRLKDIIKYMGQQVSATELEELALSYKPIKECAIIGIKSELEGELPTAVVVLKENEIATEDDIIQFMDSKLADHKRIRGGVIFTDQLPRNPQGKLMRSELRQKYKDHQRVILNRKRITDEVRCKLEESVDSAKQIIIDFVSEVVAVEVLGLKSVRDFKLDKSLSLIQQGVNSSGAVLIRNALSSSLSISLPITVVFDFNTLDSLSAHVISLLSGSSEDYVTHEVQNDINILQSEIDLSKTHSPAFASIETIRSILLTGATGFVGSHLLSQLLLTTQATIHCIVRAENDIKAKERIINKMKEQQCWDPISSQRIIAHSGDLSSSNLGIPAFSLSFLDTIDFIYHVGASVNWVLPYSQMKENVRGGVEIIKMLAVRERRVPFHFISTIGAFAIDMANKNEEGDKVLSKGLGGYPLTKWASEQVMFRAREKGLPVTIFRLPLVTPHSKTGAANKQDELIRTIQSCLEISKVPSLSPSPSSLSHFSPSNMPLQAMPVDTIVREIVSLSFEAATFQRQFVQFVSKDGASWFDVFELLHQNYNLPKVPLSQWSHQIRLKLNSPLHPILEAVESQLSGLSLFSVDKITKEIRESLVEKSSWQIDADYMRRVVTFVSQ